VTTKKIIFIFIVLAFSPIFLVSELNASATSLSERLLEEADELFDATLFENAIPLYYLLLEENPGQNPSATSLPHVRLRLVQALFTEKKYAEIVNLLTKTKDEDPLPIKQETLYILGLSYKRLDRYAEAIQCFLDYLNLQDTSVLCFSDEVHCELGLCYFLTNRIEESKPYFESLEQHSTNLPLHYLARLYLARVELSKASYNNAENRLSMLEQELPKSHILQYELAYWQGETAFQLKDYRKAAECFEKAMPKHGQEQAGWYSDVIYQLGRSYLQLGAEPQQDAALKNEHLAKAEKQFIKFLKVQPDEKAYLGLAQLYLARVQHLHDEEAFEKAETILSASDHFLTLEGQAQALMLRGALSPSYEFRNKLYKKLTDESFQKSSLYSLGWHQRGLNDFNEGIRLLKNSQEQEAASHFELAAYAFQQAFQLSNDPPAAGLALKYQAEAYSRLNSPEGSKKAYSLLGQFVHQHRKLVEAQDDPGEIFYLHGTAAAKLASWEQEDPIAIAAEQTLREGITTCPTSRFMSNLLYTLGSVLYHKKQFAESEKFFLNLISNFSESPYAGDAYFWLAKSLDKQKRTPEEVKKYKKKVFEDYSNSSYAPEAYFTYYTYRDYLQGDRTAIKHLQSFQKKFPQSCYVITAYYLMGLDYRRDRKSTEEKWIHKKNLKQAIDAFHEAESTFTSLFESGLLPENELGYYATMRYHCTLERALANLAIADDSVGAKKQIFLDYAEGVLKQMQEDLQNPQHDFSRQLFYREPYPRVLEESTYWLAQVYIKGANDSAAENTFHKMLEIYQSAKITRGYFLSKTRYDLGLLAMKQQNYSLALEHFAKAEDAAKGKILSIDQKIDLWIQQSLCCRALNDLDNSMLILSKAINDDAVSNLRIKAMYLRAEIYALQDRHELAKRQLEAASKHSGEWGQKAKQKLDEDYGY
jgi:tetratricopeptide (TPR) repeat protein